MTGRRSRRTPRPRPLAILLAALASLPAVLAPPAAGAEPITLREGLLLPRVRRAGRSPVHRDPVEGSIVRGEWTSPAPGYAVRSPDGRERAWRAIQANENGVFRDDDLRGAYVWIPVESETDRVMILDATGHSSVRVNGTPRTGDVYGRGSVLLPIQLRTGTNELLFQVNRGRLAATLREPEAQVFLNLGDTTLPTVISGEAGPFPAAAVVVNATTRALEDLTLTAAAGGRTTTTDLGPILAMSPRKVGFDVPAFAPSDAETIEVALTLARGDVVLDEGTITLRVADAGEPHERTFRSGIDGSVQYYAVQPPASRTPDRRPGLILTLHGASVEAVNQRNVYEAKDDAYVVAPNNRRNFGFDWEDWGRIDAMESLEHAIETYGVDRSRVRLTGHSMGGHGTWHLGVTYPDRFAAIAPSAGWIAFSTYTGQRELDEESEVARILNRAGNPSDTLGLVENLDGLGVYILHGAADDNVPVTEGRRMAKRLAEFHRDFAYREIPGAGHWWGRECCDWPALVDFLLTREIPATEAVERVRFVTANPGVSATRHWATILAQREHGRLSSIDLRLAEDEPRLRGTTENVARLAIELPRDLAAEAPIRVRLDGEEVEVPAAGLAGATLRLRRGEGGWGVAPTPSAPAKNPERYGPFREAFNRRVVFVYGTSGSEPETRLNREKARFDAETFWYRGNASVDVLPDHAFEPGDEPDRSVVLYGNRDTNSDWDALLGDSPIRVESGAVTVGERRVERGDLAVIFLRPREGSETATVGAVAATGPAGMRLAGTLNYFVSGVAYPDWTILGPEMLSGDADDGDDARGVLGAGYFAGDWSLDPAQTAWADAEEPRRDVERAPAEEASDEHE